MKIDNEIELGFRTPGEGFKPEVGKTTITFSTKEFGIGIVESSTFKYPAFDKVMVDGKVTEQFPVNRILRGNRKVLEEYPQSMALLGASSIKSGELVNKLKGVTLICVESVERQGRENTYLMNTFVLKSEYDAKNGGQTANAGF